MNILYLPGYRYPGSSEEPLTSGDLRYSYTLSKSLARLGHNVTVISRKDSHDTPRQTIEGVTVLRYKSELGKIFSTSFDISIKRFRLFRKYRKQADLIICNSPLSLEHILRINAPIIYVASGLEDVKNYSFSLKEVIGFLAIKLLRDPMKKLTWRRAILVNTTAEEEYPTLLKWGIPKQKIGTISSSVDSKRFSPNNQKAQILKKKLKLSQNSKIILSVSRFTPAKGVLETIQAFEKLKIDAYLLIVGVQHSHDPSYYNRVLEAIKSSSKQSKIIVKENIPDSLLPAYYAVADATSVFSKMYDPLPTVIIESMACGTPVVSTYYKTREQFITHGKTGFFVKENDLDDWVDKMSNLLNNNTVRESVSEAGLKHVADNFDSEYIANKYIRIINERPSQTKKNS